MCNINSTLIYEDKYNQTISKTIPDYFYENNREVMLFGEINESSTNKLIMELMYLDRKDPGKPIKLLINSPGGMVNCGMTILDVIKGIQSPVYTICVNMAASMASIIFTSGEKRYILPHSKILIHDPRTIGSRTLTPTDTKNQLKELLDIKSEMVSIYMERTGKSKKQIESATEKETVFKAQEAVDFGLADEILTKFN